MALYLASTTATPEELRESMKRMDVEMDVQAEQVNDAGLIEEPVAQTTTSEQPDTPGETVPADTGSETVTDPPEPVKQETTQEPPAAETETEEVKEPVKEETKTSKPGKGFIRTIEKLNKQRDFLQDELERERTGRSELQRKLDELQSQVSKLQPQQETVEPELARPKRPTRAQFEFDEDKYEAAMTEYESQLDEYHSQKSTQEFERKLAEREQARMQAEQEAQAAAMVNNFVAKRDEGRARYEDWDEYLGPNAVATDTPMPDAVRDYIVESDQPADLMYYFATHEEELEKFSTMTTHKLARELTKLEDQLSSEREAWLKSLEEEEPTEPVKATPVAAATKAPAKPAPKPLKTPDAPIEPVGSKATPTVVRSLEQAAKDGARSYITERRRAIALQNGIRI